MQIGEILDRNAVMLRVKAADKRKALAILAEVAARNFALDQDAVLDALAEREAEGSTGIGHGVAAPHARVAGLSRLRGMFVRLEQPLAFGAVDEQPVDLIFALLAPPDAGSDHLRALARVSRLLRQPALRQQLRRAATADELHALLMQDTTASSSAA